MTTVLNGWNVDAMTEAVEAVRQQPEAGKLTWRGAVTWDGAFGMNARTEAIEQMGQVIQRRFTLRGDHPPELLGQNTGPTAVETLLAALGSCITGTYAAQATARGIDLERLEVEIEGQIDLNGFFQLAPVRPGLSGVKVNIRAQANADEHTLEELKQATLEASPVYDSVAHPVSIETAVVRLR